MRTPGPLLLSAAALLLLGAGCSPTAAPATNAPSTNRPPVNAPAAAANTNAPAPASGIRELQFAQVTDPTWKTYNNSALSFTFQTPTKGRYAPTWEVEFLAENDAHLALGCYWPGDAVQDRAAERVQAGGREFCKSFTREGAAGSIYVTQHVTTRVGSRYVHITFVKRATNAGMLDCAPPPESGLSVSSEACVPFDMAAYDAQIDTIIATFMVYG